MIDIFKHIIHGRSGLLGRVADPHHFSADPDPAFRLNADSDSTLYLNADPNSDFVLLQCDGNLRRLACRQTLQGVILSLHVSNANSKAPPILSF